MLAALLSFKDSHIANPKLQLEEPEAAVERVLDPPLDEMIAAHLRACWAWANSDFVGRLTVNVVWIRNCWWIFFFNNFVCACRGVQVPGDRGEQFRQVVGESER